MCKELECVEVGKIEVKEIDGNRLVTFKDIDMVHGRVEGTARKRFNDNKEKLIENEDYFEVSPKNGQSLEKYGFSKFAPNGILLTETGYLMLVKSFTDDLAWEVQRKLVNTYFRVKENQLVEASKEIERLNKIAKVLGETLDKANEEIKESSKEVKNYYRMPHREKLNINKRIKMLLGKDCSEDEIKDVKGYVFDILGIDKWEDLPLSERKMVVDLADDRCNTIVNNRVNLFNWNKIK